MASVNEVRILGNLGRDPEVRYTPSGSAVCSISVATTRTWKDKTSGQKMEEVEWHRVAFYDRLAEIAGEYLAKGQPVYVAGRLKTRKWVDKEEIERYTTEIIADSMQLLGGKESGRQSEAPQQSQPPTQQRQAAPQQSQPQQRAAQAQQRPQPRATGGGGGGGFSDIDDDIPFATNEFSMEPQRTAARRLARNRTSF